MVKSMTGFGRAEISDEKNKVLVEMRAVNHRYLDLNLKLPRKFNLFEARIRSLIKQYAERGKLDLYVTLESFSEDRLELRYNSHLAQEYMDYFDEMSRSFGIPNTVTTADLARLPEIFTMEQQEEDEESQWLLLEEAIRRAAASFVEQRLAEGGRLRDDLLQKLDAMAEDVAYIETRSPEIVQQYREKLEAKVRELLEASSIDEARLLTEVTLFADKTCVDEETVRLLSHINGMKSVLSASVGESVGRKLDFIAQEMNREANTILSKCSHMDIAETAIRLKTEIEKIREQVQNIE